MKISTKGRYGTRAMVDIGENYATGPVSLRELAERQGISMKYMEQIIPLLKTAGLVRSIRGARGGYVLGRPPREILLQEIVEALEGKWSLVDCLDDTGFCPRTEECATYDIWQDIREAIHEVLKSTTLEAMIKRHKEKQENRGLVSCPAP